VGPPHGNTRRWDGTPEKGLNYELLKNPAGVLGGNDNDEAHPLSGRHLQYSSLDRVFALVARAMGITALYNSVTGLSPVFAEGSAGPYQPASPNWWMKIML
jgi:hypothetical protein